MANLYSIHVRAGNTDMLPNTLSLKIAMSKYGMQLRYMCVCVPYIPLISEQELSRLHRNCSRMYRVELSATVRFILFNPCTSSGTRPVGGDLQPDKQTNRQLLVSISLSDMNNYTNSATIMNIVINIIFMIETENHEID